MPAKKIAPKKATAKKATAKKATAKKATAKKATAKKATAKGRSQVASQGGEPARRGARRHGRVPTPVRRTSRPRQARRGDVIVIDSPQVGSPPREGEVLRVIHGEVSVSYRVKWADGHETLISPAAGAVTIVRT